MVPRFLLVFFYLVWTGAHAFVSCPTAGGVSSSDSSLGSSVRSIEDEQNMLQRIQRSYSRWEWEHRDKTYSINYRVEGPETAPPLLLVHGFGANVNHFRHNIPALKDAGYRVYAIDLIGFGASDKAADVRYSIELFTKLLHDFVHAMNERYHTGTENLAWMLAGNSIGGLTCLTLARTLPQQVQGVVLFNCAGGMSGFRYEEIPLLVRPFLYFMQNYVLQGDWGKQFFEGFKTEENVKNILTSQGVYRNTTHVNAELLEILLGPSDDEGAETVFLKVMGGKPGPKPESILPGVSCPVLALWGDSDPWTPHTRATPWKDLHHDFHLEILPNTGHCPHDENPHLVHSHMIPWMEKVADRYHPQSLLTGSAILASASGSSDAPFFPGAEEDDEET